MRMGLYPAVRNGKLPQVDQMRIQPLAVGLPDGVRLLQFAVIHQTSLAQVRKQHPPRLEPGFLYDLLRRDIQYAYLGGQNQLLIIREIPPAGPQAVPVQYRAHAVTIGEHNGGRAVPGLHHGGIVVVEVPLLPVHPLIVGPWLGNTHHNSLGQFHAVHHEELQGIVQHSAVTAPLVHHGQDLVHIVVHQG